MVFRLIDFALVVLKFFMLKFCGTVGVSKIKFFNFSGTEKVNNIDSRTRLSYVTYIGIKIFSYRQKRKEHKDKRYLHKDKRLRTESIL